MSPFNKSKNKHSKDKVQGSLLDKIKFPKDLRNLDQSQLSDLCFEVRHEIINSVSKTGGHLGAGLGVVELTVALHYAFDTPYDRLIWDVGHQAYPHKILTGRRSLMHSIRQAGGLSGFTKRSESEYDPFGAGHASTSISAALGMAVAQDLSAEKPEKLRNIIAVIGDGAISGGMAYEAMNNAGDANARLIVILNDNDMSIARPVGGMSKYLSKLVSSPAYRNMREKAKKITGKLPSMIMNTAKHSEEIFRSMLADNATLFEELGFYYIGPIDGHDLDVLLDVFNNVKENLKGPVLIHTVTRKGKGYSPAELAPDKFHGVGSFDIYTGTPKNSNKIESKSYTQVFSEAIVSEAQKDKNIVAITAAMPDGTGLVDFASKFPKRFFDVGIAEQHAVTFAAGLAAEGYKPFVAIYSTFLQRAYDQIVHDVSIQKLPVRFAIDRAGFVGADGPTHAGSFDIAYLCNLPDFVVMAPSDAEQLKQMVELSAAYDVGPIAFRYPRDNAALSYTEYFGLPIDKCVIGKGRVLQQGSNIAILNYGTCLGAAIEASKILELKNNITVTIVDARFCKPLDKELIKLLAKEHHFLLTIEEGSVGGFGSQVNHYLLNECEISNHFKIRNIFLPDVYLEHGNRADVLRQNGFSGEYIADLIAKSLFIK